MNGIIYCRVSSKDQVEGTSLASQEQYCLEYANRKGIKVLHKFIEKGESAKVKERTQLLKLLEFCRENKDKVDVLIVWKVDRFARNTVDHFYIKAMLAKYGVVIHSVTEPIDKSAQGQLMETVLAGFAQFDNDIRTERTVGGMKKRLEEGIWTWRLPDGYVGIKNLNGKRKIVLDKERAKIIKRIYDEYLKGVYSFSEVSKIINSLGFKTKVGKKFYPQAIKQILSNKFYAGILFNPWTQEEIKGQHESIISLNDLQKVQMIMHGRSANTEARKSINDSFPLRHFIICGHCHKLLTGSWSKGRCQKYPYYHCQKKTTPHCQSAISKDDLEKEFVKLLKRVTPKEEYIRLFERTVLDVWQQKYQELNKDRLNYQQELQKLEQEKVKIIEMKKKELLSDQEFISEKEGINEKIAVARLSMNEMAIDEFDIKAALDYALNEIRTLPKLWFGMNIQQKQRFQRLVFPEGLVYQDGEFGTPKVSLIYELIEKKDLQFSTLVQYS